MQNRDSQLETSGKIIGFYEREFYCFSNFSSFAVKWRGKLWQTSEHAYQASRFMDKNPKVVAEILKAMSADDAYKIAQENLDKNFVKYREDDLKNMEDILRHKLAQNPYVLHKLLQTKNLLIVEDSPKDSYWGWGKNKKGRNELGKIWMKLRSEIKNKNMKKQIDKKKYQELLANKTKETHAEVMQQLGITPEEDRQWHKENGGEPADWSKLEKKKK